jgi:hypothetical protein
MSKLPIITKTVIIKILNKNIQMTKTNYEVLYENSNTNMKFIMNNQDNIDWNVLRKNLNINVNLTEYSSH